jgi:hypothetical protein
MSCGHVGCCDSSPNMHASAHARATDHPIVESFEPGEDWFWCYVDEVAFLLDDVPTLSYAPGDTEEVRWVPASYSPASNSTGFQGHSVRSS